MKVLRRISASIGSNIKLIDVTNHAGLVNLYDQSALTWEGMSDDADNLQAIADWLEDNGCPLKHPEIYRISGRTMNTQYHLTNDNRYPDDLTILCIPLDNIENSTKLVSLRFDVGARWFDDVVDNNLRREGIDF